ncbi:MAG: hypothetical protein L0Y54_00855 [Sporichthyaceae bacterium]|nr:hypothetical protein [Sporichthyaceae bacterium]
MNGTWRIHVEPHFALGGHRLLIGHIDSTGLHYLLRGSRDLEMVVADPAAEPPADAGLHLAEGLWPAIVEYARPFGEGAGELRAVREALDRAETRVDRVLRTAIGRIGPERSEPRTPLDHLLGRPSRS